MHGRETGQWHEADLAVAHWLQHTSRDGDMQLHVHSQIAHVARTVTDGKWRAPDSLGYNEHVGAVAAIVSQHLEEALTRRFGVEWVARDDGHGFEIKGISGRMMRVFSSRRESITADLRDRAARFEQRYGRKPSQRELAHLAQASNFKTRNAKEGALDFAQLHAGWADKLARTLGVSLASVAPSVWHNAAGRAAAHPHRSHGPVLTELELARAAQKAVALAQQEKSIWTRADVIKYLGRVLPRAGMDPAAAAALLEDLADRALRSEFEPVVCLEAPELAEVPRDLLRADGRSVYQRHGGTRYATRAQLAMEERMLTQARADGAPRLTRAQAAHALGAELNQLEDALAGRAEDAHPQHTQTGLREDQAAAALSVADRRPARVGAQRPGRRGQDTRAGRDGPGLGRGRAGPGDRDHRVPVGPQHPGRRGPGQSYNAAQFLGHLPGRRGARGPVEAGPAPLLVIDEASMMPGPDLAGLISYAEARDGKVILAGDTSQLQAVENGGGMSLLAGALGYVRLAEPVRFRAAWEQQASLRLHDGDTTVLADYDQHGRITGGDPEQMMDAAAAAYVALTAGRHRHAADGRRPRAAPGTVPPHPRRPHRAGHRPGGPRGDHRRRRPGQLRGPDHVHPQRPHRGGGGAGPDAGQRRPAPHRRHHRDRPGCAARPRRRPAHRPSPVDQPDLPVRRLPRCRTRLRGHRPRGPGPHRDRRPGRDHRDRGPPARLRRPDPRHRPQPRVRVHAVPEAGRPGARPSAGTRTGPV